MEPKVKKLYDSRRMADFMEFEYLLDEEAEVEDDHIIHTNLKK
jgi:hypothetical protein